MTKKIPTAAAIDLGTNSFRLLLGELREDSIKRHHAELDTVRLGEGFGFSGQLSSSALQRAEEVLKKYGLLLKRFAPSHLLICGTEVLRRAANSQQLLSQVERIIGKTPVIIDSRQEAFLGLKGVLSSLHSWPNAPFFVVDIGGGSTEILVVKSLPKRPKNKLLDITPANCITEIFSLPTGAVLLTEKYNQVKLNRDSSRFSMDDVLNALLKTELTKLHAISPLSELESKAAASAPLMIVSGGSATAAAALDLRLQSYDRKAVEGYCLNKKQLQGHLKQLLELSITERNNLPCLGAGRGEILPAGLAILLHLMTRIGVQQCQISDSGLLEGIFLESYADAPLCFL